MNGEWILWKTILIAFLLKYNKSFASFIEKNKQISLHEIVSMKLKYNEWMEEYYERILHLENWLQIKPIGIYLTIMFQVRLFSNIHLTIVRIKWNRRWT